MIDSRFLEHCDISAFISSISSRSTPVRQDELNFYLDCIHLPAIKTIFDVYIEENLSQESNRVSDQAYALIHDIVANDFIGSLEKSITNGESEKSIVTAIFAEKKHLKEQSYLINKHNGDISPDKPNRNLVMNEFSSGYLERLKEITTQECV